MLEKFRKCLDDGREYAALLTDLLKAFDWLPLDLLIAKLHAYGFDTPSLRLIHSYLTKRYQRVKINNFLVNIILSKMVYHKDLFPEQYFLTACSYHVIYVFQSESSLAKWSVRVFVYELSGCGFESSCSHLYFLTFFCDLFLVVHDIDIASNANENTLCCTSNIRDEVKVTLKTVSIKAFQWFYNNGMKANSDKCDFCLHIDNRKFHFTKLSLSKTSRYHNR